MIETKKILFVLNNNEYYRNYITSSALSKIKGQCTFLVNSKVDKKIPKVDEKKIIKYSYPEAKNKLHWHLFNINTRRFSSRSTTFKFRFERMPERLRKLYLVLALPIVYHLVRFFILILTNDKQLERIIKKNNPSLILIPSSGFEGITFEIVKIARANNIPNCLLIDNWDNLCSKTIFTRKPNYLAVWGQQSAEMAERIHSVPRDKTFIVGTPRFINYYKQDSKKLLSPYPFKYALFAGNALPFDELTTLSMIDRIIEKSGSKITIIYRPHPWRHPRQSVDTFFEYDFKNVKLDNDSRVYYKKDLGDSYAPDLSYYPRLLSNMEFMICPLSTMLIEGLLFNKKVYVLTYDDGIHLTNPKNAYRFYEHFKGIKFLKNIIIIDKFEDLNLINNFENKIKTSTHQKYRKLDYYISGETGHYPENLEKMVNQIIGLGQSYEKY